MMNWWMINLLGELGHSDIYQRCNVAVFEPTGYQEAKIDQNRTDAMKQELTMIEKKHIWKQVERPQDKQVIRVKWIF